MRKSFARYNPSPYRCPECKATLYWSRLEGLKKLRCRKCNYVEKFEGI